MRRFLLYFGYPQAHEHDAERAVMAGLELVTAVTNLNAQTPLQSRVGIATGLVVVGDLIASDASQEQAIVAETPTSRHVCRASPSLTRWSLPRARANFSAIFSSSRTAKHRTPQGSRGRCEQMRQDSAVHRTLGSSIPDGRRMPVTGQLASADREVL